MKDALLLVLLSIVVLGGSFLFFTIRGDRNGPS